MLRVDQAVIDRTQEGSWRKQFFRFTPREAAEHIAFNLVVNGSTLSGIDGFADMDDSLAQVDRLPDWDITAEEEG